MKIKASKIIQASRALKEFGEKVVRTPENSQKIIKGVKAIRSAAQEVEDARTGILRKYSEDPKSKSIRVPKEKISLANEELIELEDQEWDIDLREIAAKEIGDSELSINTQIDLDFWIK